LSHYDIKKSKKNIIAKELWIYTDDEISVPLVEKEEINGHYLA